MMKLLEKIENILKITIDRKILIYLLLSISTLVFLFGHIIMVGEDSRLGQVLDTASVSLICIFYLKSLYDNLHITTKSSSDFLTGLHNREYFFDNLKKLSDQKRKFHLLIIDLNKFKIVNDTFGHGAGDALLVEVSLRLKRSFRGNDVVARLGGDEFGIILPNHLEDDQLTNLLKRATNNIEESFWYGSNLIPISMSIGVATFGIDADNKIELIQKADAAMYYAKKEKLDFYIFDKDNYIDPLDEIRMSVDLKVAIATKKLSVVYQPKYSITEDKIIGCEVLSRWDHPTLGKVEPTQFIRLAEKEGLIDQLFTNMLEQVFSDMTEWKKQGIDVSISLNVSANNLNNMEIIASIINRSKLHDIDLSKIILEVTETAIMKNPEESIKYLVMLNSLGVRLSIDDFGTGNSSFIYLKHLPIYEIKIDKTFVCDMQKSNTDLMIIASTIHLAKSCGIRVVAEGVETEDQVEKLKEYECDMLQGYYISRPMEKTNFIEYMKEQNENRK